MMSALLSRCLILFLGTLYPAYRSYKAIKNKDVREHVKWMMYWIVFALFTTLETVFDIFFSWFPFYYEIKILFILWILSPATRGSSLLYKKLVHPMLISREKEIDELIEKTKQQGYSTFLQLFSSGFQYASNLFVSSAIKGQSILGNQLKKSLSLNDVYDVPNIRKQGSEKESFSRNEIINEDNEDTDQENNFKKLSNGSKVNVKSQKTYSSIAYEARDYDLVDSNLIVGEEVISKKTTSRRRASSKQLTNTNSTSNYKSSEASHFGTITRGKANKNRLSNSSSLTAQTIYDNDL